MELVKDGNKLRSGFDGERIEGDVLIRGDFQRRFEFILPVVWGLILMSSVDHVKGDAIKDRVGLFDRSDRVGSRVLSAQVLEILFDQ